MAKMPITNSKSGWPLAWPITHAKPQSKTKKKNNKNTVRRLLEEICSYILEAYRNEWLLFAIFKIYFYWFCNRGSAGFVQAKKVADFKAHYAGKNPGWEILDFNVWDAGGAVIK